MIGVNVTRKLIPAVVPLYVLIVFILAMLDYTNTAFILFLIPILLMLYFSAANLLPIDAIAEKLEGRQRD
jgi:hypothetical protein